MVVQYTRTWDAAFKEFKEDFKEGTEEIETKLENIMLMEQEKSVANGVTQTSDTKLISGVERYRLFPKYTDEVKGIEDLDYLEPIHEPIDSSVGVLDLC